MEGTGEPAENNRSAENHWQTLSHNVVLSVLYWIYTVSSKKMQKSSGKTIKKEHEMLSFVYKTM